MTKRKSLIIVAISFVVLLSAILIYSVYPAHHKEVTSKNSSFVLVNSEVKSIDVDKIVDNPEKYTGVIFIKGSVKEVLNNKKFFTLGCEDACANLPVYYKGEMPKLESNIIASGEVKKDADGKFYFDAREIKYN